MIDMPVGSILVEGRRRKICLTYKQLHAAERLYDKENKAFKKRKAAYEKKHGKR